jgi:antitoxin (DNA-binding transcriptional repressor) of toxin-antitoxin stability system
VEAIDMGSKKAEVSAFEAKTHLAELLRETERGRSFIIRRRGKVVGRLVPPEKGGTVHPAAVLASFREIRKRVRGIVRVRRLIEEGRRR